MKNAEFNMAVRSLNIKYRDKFGVIPRITDFSCTREEYLKAMEMAIKNGKPLGDVLLVRERVYKDSF